MPDATVATFNIRHGRGLDDRVDLARTAETIGSLQADLIALQELDRFNPRSHGVDQPAELERTTGLHVHFVPTVERDGWQYGTALASTDEIPAPRSIALPHRSGEEPRHALVCLWRGLTVIATHLSVGRVSNDAQQRALAAALGPDLPAALVLGDLNRTARGLGPLTSAGLAPVRAGAGTIHPGWRRKQIDHVLVGRGLVPSEARLGPAGASDHRPVAVSLRWRVEDVLGVTYDA